MRKRSYWSGVLERFLKPGGAGGAHRPGRWRPAEGLPGYLLGEVRAFEFGSEPCGWIFAVGVDPNSERRGVASRLLAEAVAASGPTACPASGPWCAATRCRCWPSSAATASGAVPSCSLNWTSRRSHDRATRSSCNVEMLEAGAIWRVTFGASKGNVLDAALVAELDAVFHQAALATSISRPSCSKARAVTSRSGPASRSTFPRTRRECCTDFHELFRVMLRRLGRHGRRGAGRVPGRRPGARHRLPPHLRRAGREARPAGDRARRLRAGGLAAARRARGPAARRGLLPQRPHPRRARAPCASASSTASPRTRRAPRSPTCASACSPTRPPACASRSRAARAGLTERFRAEIATTRAALPRRPDADGGRGRGSERLPREAQAGVEQRMSRRTTGRDRGRRRGALPRLPAVRGARMEGRDRRPRHRLHADLRAARAAARAGRPAGRAHGRRRGPRDHPRRRLLPVLHLPHPAQHHRARA